MAQAFEQMGPCSRAIANSATMPLAKFAFVFIPFKGYHKYLLPHFDEVTFVISEPVGRLSGARIQLIMERHFEAGASAKAV